MARRPPHLVEICASTSFYNKARGEVVDEDAFGYWVKIERGDWDPAVRHFTWDQVRAVDIITLIGDLASE